MCFLGRGAAASLQHLSLVWSDARTPPLWYCCLPAVPCGGLGSLLLVVVLLLHLCPWGCWRRPYTAVRIDRTRHGGAWELGALSWLLLPAPLFPHSQPPWAGPGLGNRDCLLWTHPHIPSAPSGPQIGHFLFGLGQRSAADAPALLALCTPPRSCLEAQEMWGLPAPTSSAGGPGERGTLPEDLEL